MRIVWPLLWPVLRLVLGVAALTGCAKKPAAPAPGASSSSSMPVGDAGITVVAAPVDAGAPVTATWPSALPTPTLPAAAPIVVDGYPAPIATCLPDPAYLAGFTRDGAELGYCTEGMGLTCELVDREGQTRHEEAGGPERDGNVDRKATGVLDKAIRDLGVPELKKKNCEFFPNPLKGSFRYGDIKLKVVAIGGGVVKVGGSVGGGVPVFPFIYARPTKSPYTNGTHLNALALSPDETEIGIVTHTNCMEWCDEFEIVRMPVERFAAGIYNDAGYHAYKAKDLDHARDLFLRAAYIDGTSDLPAYNLACVYARQNDASHAEAALKLAVARGGEAVKKRARGDKDFADVKDAAWFVAVTSP